MHREAGVAGDRWRQLRVWSAAASLVGGAILFAIVVHRHYAIDRWLFWRFAAYWLTALSLVGCCGVFGCLLLSKARIRLPRLEFLTFGLALGIFGFVLLFFALGLFGGLYTLTFFGLPLGMFLAALPYLRRCYRAYGAESMRDIRCISVRPWSAALAGIGAIGVALLYVQILTPENFSFDTRWYHLPMAQRYAASHAIARFPEGFWMAAYPQLSSYLYAWAFLAPLPVFFDRVELCAHIEFVVFLLTLAQIPVLVRTLVPGSRPWSSWATLLAFPAIYLYDSNLHAGADHIAAFFAVPIALAFWRAWRHFEPEAVLLFSIFLSAAALTKYTALVIVAPAGFAMLVRAAWCCYRSPRRRTLLGLAVLVVAPLALTSMHWLKNWLWYGDPIYPILHAHLPGRPWSPDAATQLAILETVARPGALNVQGLLTAARAMFTFSFEANDWFDLRRGFPYFGSLFTLTLPLLAFVRRPGRIVWLSIGSMLAIFCWYLLSHYERFLQVVLPWMAAATAAMLVRAWELGAWTRIAMLPLLVLQFVWGSDAPFIRTHNLVGDSPIRKSLLLPPSGFEGSRSRLRIFEPLLTLGESTPKDAVVLAHDVPMILGLDRNWVTDIHQSLISYGRLREPEAIHKELRGLKVTHIVWPEWTFERESLAADLSFLNYALNYTSRISSTGGLHVGAIRSAPPQKAGGDRVAIFSCPGSVYRRGWYELRQLTSPRLRPGPAPKPREPLHSLREAGDADYIVWNPQCNADSPPAAFTYAAVRSGEQLYVRNQQQSPARTP